ncbi:major facilitator superfamily MFS-1, partial [Aureobasidium melanogenum]
MIVRKITATKLQAASYLLGVALFSISFLVFLNASISFVVTDVIGRKHGVGDVVGTLGFADELVALVACPLWGLLSDKIGVRNVAVVGYLIIGASLMLLVQSHNVYPQLLLGRMAFSIGGAACSTMVTAILPTMTAERKQTTPSEVSQPYGEGLTTPADSSARHSGAFSISSEVTITPARYIQRPPNLRRRSQKRRFATDPTTPKKSDLSQLAGYVGMFTGIGALVAVGIFLPLPVKFSGRGVAQADAVKDSFYVVGGVSIVVAVLVALTLRGLPGEEDKGFNRLFYSGRSTEEHETNEATSLHPLPSYYQLVRAAVVLGFTDSRIALGYLGGFVARASSVGISLFIPLFVNAYFIREGLCSNDPSEDIKSSCKRAYTLASMLTGFSQLTALLAAPLFGWFNGYMSKKGQQLSYFPLGLGAIAGIIGCISFGLLDNPDPFHGSAGGKGAILAVILLGFSQISAIVCSLGILAKGIQASTPTTSASVTAEPDTLPEAQEPSTTANPAEEPTETAPLLPPVNEASAPLAPELDRSQLKGTIAGVYSLSGGIGILLLTKLGGVLFDKTSTGAPFYMLAAFNAVLLIAVIVVFVVQGVRKVTVSDA